MKISTNWIKDYIETGSDLLKLADDLTMAGLEVEETKSYSKADFISAGGGGSADDTIWDVKVTPNRGDWLSVIGVARECAPLVGGKVKLPASEIDENSLADADTIDITIDAPDLCKRYVGLIVRNVKIGDSPDWMKDRLIAAGMRPINNIVDITNYVMLELGQPLHAFDYHLLHDDKIIIRRAKDGEKIISIDNVERVLDPNMLVIADGDRPVAIAGIMGGFESEIGETTRDILIESANFDAVSIRRTSKRLNMSTESSYRFERGVDPQIALLAAKRAAALVVELAGGEISQKALDQWPGFAEPTIVEVPSMRVNQVLGTDIAESDMVTYLESLGIETTLCTGILKCIVPSYRPDIVKEIDIVEEVGRVFGYDKLPMTLPKAASHGKESPEGDFKKKVRQALMNCGMQEALTHSVIDGKLVSLAGMDNAMLRVRNPLSEELNAMRSMICPNLLQVVKRNQSFDTLDMSFFEIGNVYRQLPNGGIDERASIAGVVTGAIWTQSWNLPVKAIEADFYTAKGVVESLLAHLGVKGATFEKKVHELLHPTRTAGIMLDGCELGIVGEVHPNVIKGLDLRGRPCAFELDLSSLMNVTPRVSTYSELPRFPALRRHLTAVVPDGVDYEELVSVAVSVGGRMVERVDLLDVYRDAKLGDSSASITLSIVCRAPDKTLTDEEANALMAGIQNALTEKLNVTYK